MSDQFPGIPGGSVPPGNREVPHSDLIAGLFRDVLSRSQPADAIPSTGLTLPTAGSLEAIVGQSGLDLSSPSVIAPSTAPSALPTFPAQPQKLEEPRSFLPAIAPNIPPLPLGNGIAEKELTGTPRSEDEVHSLTLPETEVSKVNEGPLTPPPIHADSPSSLSLTDQAESSEPPAPEAARLELPFGEPLGPDLGSGISSSSSKTSGAKGLSEQSANPSLNALNGPSTLGEAPDYYFLSREEEPSNEISGRTPKSGHATPVPSFDLESARRDFPALQQQSNGHPLVFLDNAATTQKPWAVIDATSHFYEKDNSNIHRAAYELAERATAAFEKGREKVREFLGAKDKKEIVFTRGTTEAINLVANTFGRKFIGAGDEILLTTLEHHANIVPWQLLAKQVGAVIKVVPINDRGELILEEYARLLSPRTKIVSVAHVSNALGTVNPVEQIIQLAHAHGVPVLVDGAQSTPHIPINVQALDADFLVFSGHKVFGPTGIGALYGKAHLLEVLPPWQGGGHMIKDVTFERTIFQNPPERFEAGTPDIAGVVGLGAAIDYLFKIGIPNIAAYEHVLLEYAAERLSEVPGLRPIGTAHNKASVLSFVIPGIPNETIASHLDKSGIAVRAGHHCALPTQRHFGLESTVRPSLAFYNTRGDIDTLVQSLLSLRKK